MELLFDGIKTALKLIFSLDSGVFAVALRSMKVSSAAAGQLLQVENMLFRRSGV